MPDIATIARANALSVEAKLTRHSKRGDGGLNLGFAIHPNDIPEQLRDAGLGTRFMMVLVELNDDETPKEVMPNSGPQPRSNKTPPASDIAKPARARKPVAPEKRLAQQAGICCADPVFWKFLTEFGFGFDSGHPVLNAECAALCVRVFCHVKSRADIIPGTQTGVHWERLHTEFLGWRDHDISISPADRTDEKALAGTSSATMNEGK